MPKIVNLPDMLSIALAAIVGVWAFNAAMRGLGSPDLQA